MNTHEELVGKIRGWFAGRLPDGLYEGPPRVTLDREEITVVGRIPVPALEEGAPDAERVAAEVGRIKEFRERTRDDRIVVAREAELSFGRKVSWGAECGSHKEMFTTLSMPVMTRLRQPERQVLDTLVEAGVARSRSDALAWCVRLVGRNAETWLGELRDAMLQVERVRANGPEA